jgi:hypothetical protein
MINQTYDTGFGPGMTPDEIKEATIAMRKKAEKRNHMRILESAAYEIKNEAKFRAKKPDYSTPLERGTITKAEHQIIINHKNK